MPSEFGGGIEADVAAQYNVLRRRIERCRSIVIADDAAPRDPVTFHDRPLGMEAQLFVGLLQDLDRLGLWHKALAGVGVVEEGDPCPYGFVLQDLSTFDSGVTGLAIMATDFDGGTRSVFALDPETMFKARGGLRVYTHIRRKQTLSVPAFASRHASMLSFGVRMFADPVAPQGSGLGLEVRDPEVFFEEMDKAFGPPASLGGGALHYDAGNVACVYEPYGIVHAHFRIRDIDAPVLLSERLLEAVDFSRRGLEATLDRDRARRA
ncbi:hypothetical protein [Gymnodinialimonas ulvae]|uniref:hypothetical protein n=1 Tax=Gymnodinialimonas ulvae TaxID=3126504 RepID=UPI0030AA027F